jgi:erythritol/L-threitol dehydrogenase
MADTTRDIPETMRAVVCHGPEDYRLERIATPRASPGEVIIRVEACGICAGDVKCQLGAAMFWGGDEPWVRPPVVAGHEFIGRVVELGPGASAKHCLKIGDRAISEQIVPCWQCRFCRSGRYWMCERHYLYGFQREFNGGMAEYMRFPADALNYRVPEALSLEAAAVIEPLACSIHAVQRAEIQLGDVAVVAGCGPLGLGMIAAAKQRGPGKLVALDLRPSRLALAREMGADVTLNPAEVDVVATVKAMTEGYGCDVYIEATGHANAVAQGLAMIRKLGTFVEFSVFGSETTVDWSIIGDRKELNIHGSHLGPYCYPLAIDYQLRGLIDGGRMVTHRYPLDAFAEAFETMHAGHDPAGRDAIKVVLTP